MTQQDFADLLGLSKKTIGRYIKGESTPNERTMSQIKRTMSTYWRDNVPKKRDNDPKKWTMSI